jgi:hypothetical protein
VCINIVSDANGVEKQVAEQSMEIDRLYFFKSYFELATIFKENNIIFQQSDIDAIYSDTSAAFARTPRRATTYKHHVPPPLSATPAASRNGGKKYGKYEKRRRTNKKKRTMMHSSKKYKKTRIN